MADKLSPLISVIIPVFNSESTIRRAAISVLDQPYAMCIELILVDDGSTDESPQILDNLSRSYSNVRVFHKENGGVSSARNMGIEKANGKYLAFLDSDDWWENSFLTEDLAVALSDSQSSDLYAFSYQAVSPNKKWAKPIRVNNSVHIYEAPSRSHIIGQHHCAFLYRRQYLQEYKFRYLPTKVWEDAPFSQLCCTFAKSITCIDRIIFSYYMNYNSCMHTRNSVNKFMEHYKSEYYVKAIYESYGITYEIDRIIISLIGESLIYITTENSYGRVKSIIAGTEFDLLNHSNIQPWQYIQKDVQLWRDNRFLAYVKLKIKGTPIIMRRALVACRLTRPLAEYIQYRLIEKWDNTI